MTVISWLNILFKGLLYTSPIIIWFVVRYFAGQFIGMHSPFYGAMVTLAPLGLLVVAYFLYIGSILPVGIYYLAALGVLISGVYGIYMEYLRWQPYMGQPGYDISFIFSNIDWALFFASIACIVIAFLAFYISTALYQKRKAQSHNKGLHGSAIWMDMAEAKKILSHGSIILGEAYEPIKKPNLGGKAPLLKFDGSGHLLTVAGSGSGKTISVAIPNVLSWDSNLVVHDPKTELIQLCRKAREAKGQKVIQLNPNNPHSDTLNVLDWIDINSETSIENAQAIVSWLKYENSSTGNNRYFEDEGAKLVLTLLLFVLFDENIEKIDKHLGTLRSLLTSELVETLEYICEENPTQGFGVPYQYAKELLTIAKNAESQWAGIAGHASNMTAWLSQPNLAKLVCGNGKTRCSIKELISGNTDFFINIPLKTLEASPAPARLLIGALLNIKYENSFNAHSSNTQKVLFLLDEMPRLKKMEILETARDAGRGAGIVLWSIIQDLGQLERYYEKHGCRSWLENAQIKTFFGISDIETAKMLSEMMDKQTVLSMSSGEALQKSGTMWHGGSSNINTSYQDLAKDLMTPGEIMSMTSDENGIPDEQLIFVRNRPPLRCGMAKWFRRIEMKALIEGD